ncbi:MAG: hypothetical protein AAF242_20240, partial [Bacteroidota bacterium]
MVHLYKELQANILKGHKKSYCLFLVFSWAGGYERAEIQRRKDWLQTFVDPHLSSMEDAPNQELVVTLSLTQAGFGKLDAGESFPNQINQSPFETQVIYRNPETKGRILANHTSDGLLMIAADRPLKIRQLRKAIFTPESSDLFNAKYNMRYWGAKKGLASGKKGQSRGPLHFKDGIAQLLDKGQKAEATLKKSNDARFSEKVLGSYIALLPIETKGSKFELTAHKIAFQIIEQLQKKNINAPIREVLALSRACIMGRYQDGTPLLHPKDENASLQQP